MRLKTLSTLATLVLLSSVTAAAMAQAVMRSAMPVMPKPQAGYSFPAHETLTYTVDWRVFPAGTAVFHLDQQGQFEHISATAETIGAVNLIYKVVDQFQSTFDRSTGCSFSFLKQTQEGRRRLNSQLQFDYAKGLAKYHEHNMVTGSQKQINSSIPACVTDDLSAIFFPSSQDLVVGHSFGFPLAGPTRTVAVTMKVEDHEQIKTPLGTFSTIRVQPTADAGVVKNRGNIWIWYTDDARHIPVQMRARLFWGTITFELTSISNH